MLVRLLLLFTLVPVVELILLLRIGRQVGFWPTLGGVLVVGAIGAYLARRELRRVLDGWRRALSEGRAPEQGLAEGLLVLCAGLLLITPGVLTDAVGLGLLIPPVRRPAAAWVRRWFERQLAQGTVRVATFGSFRRRPGPGSPPRPRFRGEEDAEVIGSDGSDSPGTSGDPRP